MFVWGGLSGFSWIMVSGGTIMALNEHHACISRQLEDHSLPADGPLEVLADCGSYQALPAWIY